MPTNDPLNTSLIEAATYGDLEQILKLVPAHPFKDWDFAQALYWAVSYNRVACVQYLLDRDRRGWDMCPEKWVGVKFEQASWYEKSVSNASDLQQLECLNLLVDALYGMRNPPVRFFQNAFIDACVDGKHDSAQRLLEVIDPTGTTFVHKGLGFAASSGHIKVVRMLMSRLNSTHWVDNHSKYCPEQALLFAVLDRHDRRYHAQDTLIYDAIIEELKDICNPVVVLEYIRRRMAQRGEVPAVGELQQWADNCILQSTLQLAVGEVVRLESSRKI